MRIIESDERKHYFKVIPEDYEDLWILDKILHPGDIIEGRTTRTVQIGNKKESILCYIKIELEKKLLERQYLKISGKIIYGKPEKLIPLGSYHSFKFKIGDEVTFTKKDLTNTELELLNTKKIPDYYILSLDEDECEIYEVKNNELKFIKKIRNSSDELELSKYFSDIIKETENYENIIICGTGFAPEELAKRFPKKVMYFKTSMAGKIGAKEVLKDHSKDIFKEYKLAKHMELLEKFKELLYKNPEKVAYGYEDVKENIYFGETLLIAEKYYLENTDRVYELIKNLESVSGTTHIVPIGTDIHDEIYGFGGIILIKRW
jgi:mRNA surveillance protein pelota